MTRQMAIRTMRRLGRKGSRSDATLESEDDPVTAAGAGLKALAMKLDLEEFSDPADLDEADPVIDLEEPSRAACRQKATSQIEGSRRSAAGAQESRQGCAGKSCAGQA
jgi:hypothetical protein